MSGTRERELVQAIRAELAAIDPPRACCRVAERAGLGAAATGRARSPVVARLAVRLAEAERAAMVPAGAFEWGAARDHCRAAWLRGRFLAAGSLSLGARGAHLELVAPPDTGEELQRRLEQTGFALSVRTRRGRAVLTSKRTDTILAFLRFCGGGASVLEIESRLVMRQLQGHLNRVLNAESANLERTVASSARQIAVIDQLEAEGRLGQLSPVERQVAQARRIAPEASFTELASTLGFSRARVQRAFERIGSVAATTGPVAD